MTEDRYATPAFDEAHRQLLRCWRYLFDIVQDDIDPGQVEPKEKLLLLCTEMLEIYGVQVDAAKLQAGLVAERPADFEAGGEHVKRMRMFMPPQAA